MVLNYIKTLIGNDSNESEDSPESSLSSFLVSSTSIMGFTLPYYPVKDLYDSPENETELQKFEPGYLRAIDRLSRHLHLKYEHLPPKADIVPARLSSARKGLHGDLTENGSRNPTANGSRRPEGSRNGSGSTSGAGSSDLDYSQCERKEAAERFVAHVSHGRPAVTRDERHALWY